MPLTRVSPPPPPLEGTRTSEGNLKPLEEAGLGRFRVLGLSIQKTVAVLQPSRFRLERGREVERKPFLSGRPV